MLHNLPILLGLKELGSLLIARVLRRLQRWLQEPLILLGSRKKRGSLEMRRLRGSQQTPTWLWILPGLLGWLILDLLILVTLSDESRSSRWTMM